MTMKRENYLFISAFLRARESQMVSRTKAEQMLDAPTFDDCAKMLVESGYDDMSQLNLKQIETKLSEYRTALFRELETMLPDVAALDLFRLKYDYHNIKVLIKSGTGPDAERLLSDSGRVPAAKMKALYEEDLLREIPGLLPGAAAEAKALLERSANPQLADFLLDQAYFTEMKTTAEKLGSGFADGYVRILADTTNLRSAVRVLRMGKDIGYLHEALVPGGSVSEDRIVQAIGRDGLQSAFAGSALSAAAELGSEIIGGGRLTEFELACDNAVQAYLSSAKRSSYGVECVLGYLAGKETELTAIRMILTGRLAGVPTDTIRERLRDLYA